MQLLFQYIKQQKKILLGAIALATVNQVFSLLDPQIFRLLIDHYATRIGELTQADYIRGVVLLLLGTMGVAFVSRLAKNFQDYYVNVITQRVGTQLYSHSVAHSFSLPYAVFEDQRSGELLRVLQRARDDAQKFIISLINIVFVTLVGIAFVIIYAFFVHWVIGFVYFMIIPVLGITTFFISRKIKQAQVAIVAQTADLAGSTTETLRNVELVKSLGLEEQETERLNEVNEKILQLELIKIRRIRTFSFIQGTLINLMRSALMFLMLYLMFIRVISLGEFFSLLFYSFFIFNPLAEFGNVATQYQEAKGSMEALEKILAIQPEEKPKAPVVLPTLETLEFKNVSFAYGSEDTPSIADIDISLKKGETIALVGPSGAGKSTLIKLLVGLYRPTKGDLLLNGIAAEKIDYDDLRRRIGYVSQETQLFAGTIRENLLFVRPNATDEECLHALQNASAMGIIERGGKGLDTKIGEGGIKISGGERQRLAIARALLRNPELIIFDEATSSLDSITERAITETIKDIRKKRSNLMMVLIAHRLSTVSHADAIYVLERGRVVEQGGHDELLHKQGLYAALWREQSSHD